MSQSGALARLALDLAADLDDCHLCPRCCGVDRTTGSDGRCGTGVLARVRSAYPHFGEEGCLTGRHGSGTIFMAGCGLGCRFCPNPDIDVDVPPHEVTAEGLAGLMLDLQGQGCLNVNLVTPGHLIPQCVAAIDIAACRGLRVPIVFNSGGYESAHVLRRLEGVVDVFLPDLKTLDRNLALQWFDAADYPDIARAAILEMHRQVGRLVIDADGNAVRGLLVRHLVMPGATDDAIAVMAFLASLGSGMSVSILDQYRPPIDPSRSPGIGRRPATSEVAAVVAAARRFGLRTVGPAI